MLALCAGCGSDTAPAPPTTPPPGDPPEEGCAPGSRAHPDGGCCPAGTALGDDGACIAAGIVSCASGFELVDDACEPILPSEPCGPAELATPGMASCEPLAACGSAPWGDIVSDAATEFVDGAFVGVSDGSSASPWTTIAEALAAAADGAVIAIAAGSYEAVTIDKPVVLWGRCPDLVSLVSPAEDVASIVVAAGVVQATLRGIAVTGPGRGITISGSDTRLEAVWVHETLNNGIVVTSQASGTTIDRVLIQGARRNALAVIGSDLALSRSAIVDTAPFEGDTSSIAAAVWDEEDGPRSMARFESVLIDNGVGAGIIASTSDLEVVGSVVRNIQGNEVGRGWCVSVQAGIMPGTRGSLVLRDSLVEHCGDAGVWVGGADASVASTVVRHVEATVGESQGVGIFVQPLSEEPGVLTMEQSLVADVGSVGIYGLASDLTLRSVWVREVRQAAEQKYGRGVYVESWEELPREPFVTIEASRIERVHDAGIAVSGGTLVVDAVVVTDVAGNGDKLGRGLAFQIDEEIPSHGGSLDNSLVEAAHGLGVAFVGVGGSVRHTLVRGILTAPDGRYGDGIVSQRYYDQAPPVVVSDVVVEGSARVGIAAFGGVVELGDTRLECNAIDLNGEVYTGDESYSFAFDDRGGNTCRCGDSQASCVVQSSGLEPPVAEP
jgi:hypothetical protein